MLFPILVLMTYGDVYKCPNFEKKTIEQLKEQIAQREQRRKEKSKAFVDGAEWRINSVWHDIKEMPENNRMILIIMQHDIPTVLGPDNTFFKEEVKDRQIHRWAYVDDLKPNIEE